MAVSNFVQNALPGKPFGDNKHGDITYSSNTTITPTYTTFSGTAGNGSFTATSPANVAAGDLLLLIQVQSTTLPWVYEWVYCTGKSGSTIYITPALTNSYSITGDNRAQAIVVQRYRNFKINSGVTVTVADWDGTKHGVLPIVAHDINIVGNIRTDGSGYRGGAKYESCPNGTGALQGESWDGSETRTYSTNYGGGGGGYSITGFSRVGGGGGGHGAAGSNPTDGIANGIVDNGTGIDGVYARYGRGGGTYGVSTGLKLSMGSGGGGSITTNGGETVGDGGNGGGVLYITGQKIYGGGYMTSNGDDGESAGSAGGGAGSGGYVRLVGDNVNIGTNRVYTTGGTGGVGGGSDPDGGDGGVGYIHITYRTALAGSTTATTASTQDFTLFEPQGAALLAALL